MSLKFFFNRKGPVVLSLTVIGWALALLNLYKLPGQWEVRGQATGIIYIAFLFLCGLITVIRFIPWYHRKDRGAGIEEHFEKTLVPTSYIMVVANSLYFFWMKAWPFLVFIFPLLLLIMIVNGILLYFHKRDKNTTPPSYFARSLYKTPETN